MAPNTQPIRVWDLPTRLFHWLLLINVVALIVTGTIGGGLMVWHFRLGYAVLALLLFRIVWGLMGGRWSRFASFVRGPGTLLRYLRGQAREDEHLDVGHNPLGALSVLGLLGVLLFQVACGLVADDEIANIGPLNRFVSTDLAAWATSWHKGWGEVLIFALVGLHIAAIAFYKLAKRLDLIGPMVRGDKPLPPGTPASRDDLVTRLLALAVLAAAASAAVAVSRMAP